MLIALMVFMTILMGFAMQTRWLSPPLDNFILADGIGWVHRVESANAADGGIIGEIVALPISLTGSNAEKFIGRMLDKGQVVLIVLLFNLTPYSLPILSIIALATTCWFMVSCGGVISRPAAWFFGASIALNPFSWIWPLGIYKEPYLLLVSALLLIAVMRPRIPTLLVAVGFVLSFIGLVLRPEPVFLMMVMIVFSFTCFRIGRGILAVWLIAVIGAIVFMSTWLDIPKMLGIRTDFYTEHFYARYQPEGTTGISRFTYQMGADLYTNQLLRPLGMALNSAVLVLNPLLRPTGIGDGGLLLAQAGRWFCKALCSLAVLASIIHIIRWRKTSDWCLVLSATVFFLLLVAVSYPVLVDRYFYPALVFAVPLMYGLPERSRRGLLYAIPLVVILGPLLLLLLGYPPPVKKDYLIVEPYQNPLLPGSTYVPGSAVSE